LLRYFGMLVCFAGVSFAVFIISLLVVLYVFRYCGWEL
jgi:hypothetical protein